MSPIRRIFALTVVLFGVTVVRGAGATSTFPSAIQTDLALAHPPACALCHTTGDSGGRGTVNTPFGTTIRGRGLVAYDEAGLKSALAAMIAEKTDSDRDCVSDIDELKQGSDPNTPNGPGMMCAGPAAPQGDTPQYGCGAHVTPLVPTSTSAFPFALAIAAIAGLRRRGRLWRGRRVPLERQLCACASSNREATPSAAAPDRREEACFSG